MSGRDDTLLGLQPPATTGAADQPTLVAGRYQILRWLGGGGMGSVYEARDGELEERVALKMLRAGLTDVALERFRREVKLTRRIQHRNVARMFDIGEHAGDRFLTMELIDGDSLTSLVGTPVPWARLRDIAIQLCHGLSAAHALGVVHRDLKPDNVLIEAATQRVVITDFGIARGDDDVGVTQAGTLVGTPRYMAPEQLAGQDVDSRADLFSLGLMLFELASGARPWGGASPIEIAVAQATQPPRPLRANLPAEAIEVIEACLALDPANRPASAELIAERLGAASDAAPRRAGTPSLVTAPIATPTLSARRRTSIAVLPFRGAVEQQDLTDWLHEELIDLLSMSPDLRVRPARASHTADIDPRVLGRELEVDHVVDGSVRRGPAGLRVSARLIGVADGFQIWANRTDYAEAEVLGMSERLAREISDALSATAASATVESAPLSDPRAIELYLRARGELRRFWGEHAENAAALLDKALVYAPESRELLGSLAVATAQAWVRRGDPSMLARAQLAVERATAANVGEAELAVGLIRMNVGDVEGGAVALAAALARAPMSGPAHETAGRILIEVERVPDGLAHFDTAVALDPGRMRVIEMDRMRVDAFAGDWASAERRSAALATDPDPAIAQLGAMTEARLATWRGDPARGLAAARRLGDRVDDRNGMYGVLARHLDSEPFDRARWDTMVAGMMEVDKPRRGKLSILQRAAEIGLLVGEVAAATDAIAGAIELGLIDIVWFDRCPLLAPVRDGARGGALREVLAARAARVRAAF